MSDRSERDQPSEIKPSVPTRPVRRTATAVGAVLLLAALVLVAYLLLRDNDHNDSVVVQGADSSAAAVTQPAATLPVTTPPVTTLPGNAPADVIDTASRSATFSGFLALVEAAGLTNELRQSQSSTVFAPTESAFAALPNDVQIALRSPANQPLLARIVRFHVLNQTLRSAQLVPGSYKTSEGSNVVVQNANGAVRIGDASITGADVETSNGVLHAIDALLVPPGINLADLVSTGNTTAGTAN